jgi:hypothetical protein
MFKKKQQSLQMDILISLFCLQLQEVLKKICCGKYQTREEAEETIEGIIPRHP